LMSEGELPAHRVGFLMGIMVSFRKRLVRSKTTLNTSASLHTEVDNGNFRMTHCSHSLGVASVMMVRPS